MEEKDSLHRQERRCSNSRPAVVSSQEFSKENGVKNGKSNEENKKTANDKIVEGGGDVGIFQVDEKANGKVDDANNDSNPEIGAVFDRLPPSYSENEINGKSAKSWRPERSSERNDSPAFIEGKNEPVGNRDAVVRKKLFHPPTAQPPPQVVNHPPDDSPTEATIEATVETEATTQGNSEGGIVAVTVSDDIITGTRVVLDSTDVYSDEMIENQVSLEEKNFGEKVHPGSSYQRCLIVSLVVLVILLIVAVGLVVGLHK